MKLSKYIAITAAIFTIGAEGTAVLTMPDGYNSEELQTIERIIENVTTVEATTEESVQVVEEKEVFITTDPLRLRTAPSTDSYVIKTVPAGTIVEITGDYGEWNAVIVNGQAGYMFSAYIISLTELQERSAHVGDIEQLHWSYVRNILPQNTPVMITDVRTGLTYWMISFSHGNHADVFPATAEDTAIFHSTFNYQWSWNTRPVLVHFNDRTVAASINGMPHGSGEQRNRNNMFGHVCLHFYGSKTHNGNTFHENDHQGSVREALRAGN
ncbi:MAG: SH3 domain-containing protein [Defluviitaleaceae bacterium]|nr:SH3 domain-containing protein [Defluviitaleaceae bacterium]